MFETTDNPTQYDVMLKALKDAYQEAGVVNEAMCLNELRLLRPPMTMLEIDHVCDVLREQVQSWADRDPGKIPALHNWIRWRRWMDSKPKGAPKKSPEQRLAELRAKGHIP